MQNRPAFEIPYTEISNTNLAGKNEVTVDLAMPTISKDEKSTNGSKAQDKKAAASVDILCEIRFYVPGMAEKDVDGENGSVDGEEAEEHSRASVFYDTLMKKANIGEVAGDTYATFLDVLHLTPRWVLFP